MNTHEPDPKKISFREAGKAARQSFDFRFLFRRDVASIFLVLFLTRSLNTFYFNASSAGATEFSDARFVLFSYVDLAVSCLFSLIVIRSSLTAWRNVRLLYFDRSTIRALCFMVFYWAPALLGAGLSVQHDGFFFALLDEGGSVFLWGLSLLVLLLVSLWIWAGARCVDMALVAWQSGRPAFRIRRGYDAMKGHVWAYGVWLVAMVLVTGLPVLLFEKATRV